jgi:hypothetical protein
MVDVGEVSLRRLAWAVLRRAHRVGNGFVLLRSCEAPISLDPTQPLPVTA